MKASYPGSFIAELIHALASDRPCAVRAGRHVCGRAGSSVHGEIWTNAIVGALLGLVIIGVETRLREAEVTDLLGALIGGAIGLGLAKTIGAALFWADASDPRVAFLHSFTLLVFPYLGIVMGARKGEWLQPARLVSLFRDAGPQKRYRLLDTSVIIDGRIADVCETGFLDGTLVIPQFVLKELQLVADSADSLKRNRGRRGLDILQKVQKMSGLDVMISDIDFPEVREVDLKLIELARTLQGKIVTNDFNLNKVAQLRGVQVLNINELANALKPVVLPGEFMKVFILKEGKEYNQGVAYLDDGTMVVVDNARRMISKNIDIVVTSVLQTTAGKMIFGRYIEGPGSQSSIGPGRGAGQQFRRGGCHGNGRRESGPAEREVIPPYHWWRTVFFLIPAIAVYTIVLGTTSILSSLVDSSGDFGHRCARAWAWLVLRTTGVRVTVRGIETLEPGRSYVFASNHQSIYDIPIVFASIPLQLRIVAKASLGTFPFLGWHLRGPDTCWSTARIRAPASSRRWRGWSEEPGRSSCFPRARAAAMAPWGASRAVCSWWRSTRVCRSCR